MKAMNLVETTSPDVSYGVIICHNDNVEPDELQRAIDDAKLRLDPYDWQITDVLNLLPEDWKVEVQCFQDIHI